MPAKIRLKDIDCNGKVLILKRSAQIQTLLLIIHMFVDRQPTKYVRNDELVNDSNETYDEDAVLDKKNKRKSLLQQ